VFHGLGQDQIRTIATIQLKLLRERLQARDLTLEVTDEVMEELARAGFDPVYGARPLKRAIRQQLENPLAREILQGKYLRGDTVQVDWQDGAPVFTSTAEQAA